jgi:hypothetical protein
LTQTRGPITSDVTPHTAQRRGRKWWLSFMPGREWARAQADAGMQLAATVSGPRFGAWEAHWIAGWARTVGEPVSALVASASQPVHETSRRSS